MNKNVEGKLLVASPHLKDSNFFRTVILMVRHSEEEAFGVILNRPTEHRLKDVITMVSDSECVHDLPIHYGGPVEGPLMAVHDLPDQTEDAVRDGISLSIQQSTILDLVARSNVRLKVFDGYSGWGPGQLDDEISAGGWLVAEATSELVFSDAQTLWENVIREINREILAAGNVTGGSHFDSSQN